MDGDGAREEVRRRLDEVERLLAQARRQATEPGTLPGAPDPEEARRRLDELGATMGAFEAAAAELVETTDALRGERGRALVRLRRGAGAGPSDDRDEGAPPPTPRRRGGLVPIGLSIVVAILTLLANAALEDRLDLFRPPTPAPVARIEVAPRRLSLSTALEPARTDPRRSATRGRSRRSSGPERPPQTLRSSRSATGTGLAPSAPVRLRES